jgi:hypothetical protein
MSVQRILDQFDIARYRRGDVRSGFLVCKGVGVGKRQGAEQAK